MTSQTEWAKLKPAGYAIYDHPSDFPAYFVARQWFVDDKGRLYCGRAFTAETLEGARAAVPVGAVRFEPDQSDDPKIVEVWI